MTLAQSILAPPAPLVSPAESRSAGQAAPVAATAATTTHGRLVLEGIHKHFGPAPVLQGISLTCEPGEFLVVVGPSGCGKSTLLNIAAGMTQPDAGRITLDGRPVTAPGPERAMVFQDHGLFPWLTAADNIDFGLKMAGVAQSERRDRVAAALKMVHLTHSANKPIHHLSGGMPQRVAIARALVMNPALLLMDEPFAALDAQTRTLLHEQLQELWCNTHKTILFVTHSVNEAVRLGDRIIVLHAHPGRVRREIQVDLPHPRSFDNADLSRLSKLVRREIEDEVNHVHAREAAEDHWRPAPGEPAGTTLGPGDGI